MLANTPSRQVQSVRTAFELINRLQALGGATPAQLTEELDLSKSSVHNYLATLEVEGYLVNDGGTYRLGLRFLTHGTAAKYAAGVERPIVRTVRSVAEELAESTWGVAEEFGRGYFMENATPADATTTYGSVGKRSYLHTHALGKAILAGSSDEYVERVADHHGLPEQTRRTTTDVDDLIAELETVRERGFAVSEGEAVLGILSVGVGFRDADDRRHAIGVFGHSRDFAGNHPENIGERLVEAVGELERRPRSEGE
ncbi:IclR family transcriptional regulator [Halomarina halobia]|uniref:IclR family transcriptional regulator n=1 Tax=Halomarina halobia TaxID=3033386 RepID=A0ABD6ADW9_9EURY|nr:IclR family transcriptional regulator C-terminal domain-containing protein [Halomarina sp. PSR21]